MLKVGIELPDKNLNNVDFSNPELGNPGVGGSEYLFALLSKELHKKGIDVTIYHYGNNIINPEIKSKKTLNKFTLLDEVVSDKIDILIHQVGKTNDWYNRLSKFNIKTIAWAHVYLEYQEIKSIRSCDNVKRVVFVGKEEYDAYIDDDIIYKSTYIYNMLPTDISIKKRKVNKPVVTYIGSLVPQKGFHKLAAIWPDVIKQVPEAELNIIGTGKVYNRNANLGKYGIAEEQYEKVFMNYLTDNTGKILPSVHFLGIVGSEKNDILYDTKVGVVNPTALTETFCMSAIEMEIAYVPVISKRKWGLLDTVKNKYTGYLFSTKSQFIKKLVKLLVDDELNAKFGENAHYFVKNNFGVDVIIPQWIELLNDIKNDSTAVYHKVNGNYFNDNKLIKIILRFIRINLKLNYLPSYYDIKNNLKSFFKR